MYDWLKAILLLHDPKYKPLKICRSGDELMVKLGDLENMVSLGITVQAMSSV